MIGRNLFGKGQHFSIIRTIVIMNYLNRQDHTVSQNEPTIPKQSPRFLPVFVTSIILILIGAGGLGYLFLYTVPTLGPRWFLYFLVTALSSGLVLPVVYYLHLRFPSKPPVTQVVIVREALWFGVYADIVLWLQLGKVLNPALAIFIAIGLLMIEIVIRMRERSRFTPR